MIQKDIKKEVEAGSMAITGKGLRLLLAGVIVMISGYILMTGGGVKDPEVFNYAMFDFRRLVAAPVVILSGIAIIIAAIMRTGKDAKTEKTTKTEK